MENNPKKTAIKPQIEDFHTPGNDIDHIGYIAALDEYNKNRTDEQWAQDIFDDLMQFLKDEAEDLLQWRKFITVEQIKELNASDRVYMERCGMSIPRMDIIQELLAKGQKSLEEKQKNDT